jgi:hypothetical protein
MESEWFKKSKKIGRWFEAEVDKVLKQKGCEVVDSEKLSYQKKKGWDRLVKIKGEQSYLEIKFDRMAEDTPNVCVEVTSLNQSISPIWIYGLPTQKSDGYVIDLYTMYLHRLKPLAARYPVRYLGEHKNPCHLIPRYQFTEAQDNGGKVVNHFHQLVYETKPRVLLPF